MAILIALAALPAAALAQSGSAGSGSSGSGSAGSTMQRPSGPDTMTPTGRSDSSTTGDPSPAPRNGAQGPAALKNTDSVPPSKTAPGRVDAPK
jgi:hypothetical protein